MSLPLSNRESERSEKTRPSIFAGFALLLCSSLLASNDQHGSPDKRLSHIELLRENSVAIELTTRKMPAAPVPMAADVWSPAPGTSWQIQLQGTLNTSLNVDMYDIDLFDTPVPLIDALKSRNIAVICYFSAGSWEDWRPDAQQIPASVRGEGNGWPGEKWLDIRAIDTLAPVMTARLDLAVAKGCDGVDPDNVDGFTNRTGFPLTSQHQLDYNKWLATEAHARSLSIGLKNDLLQIEDLEPYFDWALNESCLQYDECELLLPFVKAGKAVFGIEYSGAAAEFCTTTNALNFDWLKKSHDLGATRQACRQDRSSYATGLPDRLRILPERSAD
jgi:hypothetical protein